MPRDLYTFHGHRHFIAYFCTPNHHYFKTMKVTVVGAGNVGATCANVLATREVANEVVLLDIKDGFAEGKALDIWETAPSTVRYPHRRSDQRLRQDSRFGCSGDHQWLATKARMSRDDLIATNSGIVKSVTQFYLGAQPGGHHHCSVQSVGCDDLLRLPHCK